MHVFIKADPAHARAIYAALAEFGALLQGISPEDFADRSSFFRFGHDPNGFDILPDMPGVVLTRRGNGVESVIDPASGLKANFISADDLITSKLASGHRRTLPTRTPSAKPYRANGQRKKRPRNQTAPGLTVQSVCATGRLCKAAGVDKMRAGTSMTAESSQPQFEILYHRAFTDYKLLALWNVHELEHPSPEEALTITRNLRVEGDLSARRLAEQIEQACRAAL